jgi:DNA-binding transcriptional MerR regulator
VAVLIGELAQRTGSSARSLRHYDGHGLLPVARTGAGYRDFPFEAVARVGAIRGLLACGLTLAEIRTLLPCTTVEGTIRPCREVLASLSEQLKQLDKRATEVDLARQVIQQHLASISRGVPDLRSPALSSPDDDAERRRATINTH